MDLNTKKYKFNLIMIKSKFWRNYAITIKTPLISKVKYISLIFKYR